MNLRPLAAATLLSLALAACAKSGATPSIGAPEPMSTGPAGPGAAATSTAPAYGGDDRYAARDAAEGEASVGASPSPMPQPEHKPGLGTSYGEQRFSAVRTVRFRRADPTRPAALLSMRYNDAEGVRQISQIRTGGYPQAATSQYGTLTMTLRDESGSPLPGAQVGSDVYAVGEAGARYVIGVENHSDQRYEAVATVDGLDVIDGQEGDFSKRGYLVDPYTSFVIEGWRTSDDTVAAFRFSDMDSAYAERMGKGRNIGVIGVAFFHEEGAAPRRDDHELRRRDAADPFPNRYAPPPPGYRAHGG